MREKSCYTVGFHQMLFCSPPMFLLGTEEIHPEGNLELSMYQSYQKRHFPLFYKSLFQIRAHLTGLITIQKIV